MRGSMYRAGLALTLLAATLGLGIAQTSNDKKFPIPDKDAQNRAHSLVDAIFGEDIKQAKSADKLSQLAAELMQQGRESKAEPANRFVLFQEARNLAARAGNASLALLAIEELNRSFQIHALDMKASTLALVAESTENKDASRVLVDLVLPMVQDAIDADNYEAALALTKVAETAAKHARSLALVTSVRKRYQEVLAVQKGFSRLQVYVDRLKKNPKDAEANLEMGRYYAFLKGRWEKALPLLANSDAPVLSKLASADLAEPRDEHKQLALADGWWNLAEDEEDPAKVSLQSRARFWYEKAIYKLSGLNRTKALKRIDAINSRLASVTSEGPAGPVGELKKFEGHNDEIKSVAFSPDGRQAVSGSVDQTVRVWDLVTGKEINLLRGHTKQVWSVAFHPNGRQVFSASWDATARLWDVKSGNEVKRFSHRLDLNGLAVSRDGNQLLTASDDHHVYLWNVVTGEEIRRYSGHTAFVYRVCYSRSGQQLASGSVDRTVRVYDVASGNLVRVFSGHNASVTQVAFSPDGRYVFSCGDDAAHQWDIGTGKEVRRFDGHAGNVVSMALSPNGRRLITGGDDKTIRVWDVATGKQLAKLEGHTDSVTALDISADGRKAVSGSLDRTVRLWGLPH